MVDYPKSIIISISSTCFSFKIQAISISPKSKYTEEHTVKKIISMLLTLAMVLSLAGCAGTTVVVNNYNYYGTDAAEATTATTATEATEPVTAEGAVRTGLAIVTDLGTVDASADAEGNAEFDITLAAILVDENDVILDCAIDSIGHKFTFDATGAITSDLTAEVLTKNEKGDNYGMVAYGNAKAEWYQQVDAFESYCIGKTIYEIQDGALTDEGYAADADLATSATIKLDGYVTALLTAHTNAQVLGAEAGDKLVLSSITSQADAAQGNAQLNVDAVALTTKDGVITSCQLDSLQGKATIDEKGAVTGTNVDTKNTLGFGYNMVAYGNATYEWFEQAANFASYITGKTAAEVAGIAIDEATKPADADLATSVTISIYGFKSLIAKALGTP